MSTSTFAETHNLVAFLEKPSESEGFKKIIDFLNAKPIIYALTVNPTVYASCLKQFWTTTKVKKVDGQELMQALVDKQKKKIKPKRKQRQATEVYSPSSKIPVKESVPTPSNDPLPSEKKRKSRPAGLRRLKKVGSSRQVESSEEKDSLSAQEDASKQGRSIEDIDQNAEIAFMREKIVKKEASTGDPVTTAGEVVTTASVEDSVAPTTATTADVDDELTLEKTLIAIKATKPKVISTAATTVTTAITHQELKNVEESLKKTQTEITKGSSKRAGEELEQESAKKQKLGEHVEAEEDNGEQIEVEEDNDQREAEMKMYMKIIPDDEIAIDSIPLATKPLVIMLQHIDREDMETLWKLVKAKYGNTRPEEGYERVLYGDLKVMFEPDVEKRSYPLTPVTITRMLNKKLQADHWNEMCYQLLKLMLK
nr:hypothetical protein [Tanacetum cinerariifolium]